MTQGTERYCTGCGRRESDPKPSALACCPDNRYRLVDEIIGERAQLEGRWGAAVELLTHVDKTTERSWNKWLWDRDQVLASTWTFSSDVSDAARLNFLQSLTKGYGRGWLLGESTTGRGMRLHETSHEDARPTVREAIDFAMKHLL